MFKTKEELLTAVLKSLPYSDQITELDISTSDEAINFIWRKSNKFRIGLLGEVEEVIDGFLIVSDVSILFRELLRLHITEVSENHEGNNAKMLEKKIDWGYKKLILNKIDEYDLITFELQQFISVGSEGLHICLTKKQVKKVIKFLKKQVKYTYNDNIVMTQSLYVKK